MASTQKSEAAIQAECVKLLQNLGIFCHSIPNEGAGGNASRTSRLVAMGLRKGVADLCVWWKDGIGYLEFKDAKGKQSEAQRTFEDMCHERMIDYRVVRSVSDVAEIVRRHYELDMCTYAIKYTVLPGYYGGMDSWNSFHFRGLGRAMDELLKIGIDKARVVKL